MKHDNDYDAKVIALGVVLAIVLAYAHQCRAADNWRINLNLTSYHYSDPDPGTGLSQHNSENFGIGLEYNLGDSYVIAGVYDNSFHETSFYAGMGSEIFSGEYVRCGIEVALATGYEDFMDKTYIDAVGSYAIFIAPYISVGSGYAIKAVLTPGFTAVQLQVGF